MRYQRLLSNYSKFFLLLLLFFPVHDIFFSLWISHNRSHPFKQSTKTSSFKPIHQIYLFAFHYVHFTAYIHTLLRIYTHSLFGGIQSLFIAWVWFVQSEELVAYSKYSNYLSTSSFLASLTLSRQNVNDKNREPASCYSVRVCQKKNIYITKKTLFFNADVSFIFICSIIGTKNRKRQIVDKKNVYTRIQTDTNVTFPVHFAFDWRNRAIFL